MPPACIMSAYVCFSFGIRAGADSKDPMQILDQGLLIGFEVILGRRTVIEPGTSFYHLAVDSSDGQR